MTPLTMNWKTSENTALKIRCLINLPPTNRMRILLDTLTLLWIVNGDSRLSEKSIEAYRSADEIFWSVVSLWEIGLKLSLGKVNFQMAPDWSRKIPDNLRKNGGICLPVEPSHCRILSELPWLHRDPFDRLLISQAQAEDLTLVTCNARIRRYTVKQIW
ncbi:MAG: type II toxin-antitoxin system VapC family toxin [Verrucomicrobiaceae bacterium]|nr:MAG: type II toxin-antitoxin system VapC family toxin [Verrucomicrobiaceae bacterium]